jgi:hypothetical protein
MRFVVRCWLAVFFLYEEKVKGEVLDLSLANNWRTEETTSERRQGTEAEIITR